MICYSYEFFAALNILDTIQTLRADDDDDLHVQCDVFEEELNADSEAIENMNDGKVNVNDHTSVFTAIYKRVRADIAAEVNAASEISS